MLGKKVAKKLKKKEIGRAEGGLKKLVMTNTNKKGKSC